MDKDTSLYSYKVTFRARERVIKFKNGKVGKTLVQPRPQVVEGIDLVPPMGLDIETGSSCGTYCVIGRGQRMVALFDASEVISVVATQVLPEPADKNTRPIRAVTHINTVRGSK